MKEKIGIRLIYSLCFLFLLISCDDDNDEKGSSQKLNGIYSNKLSSLPNSNSLDLMYSDYEFIGKDVYFDGDNASLTLFGILPGEEKTVIENVPLIANEGGYIFSGNSTTTNATSLSYTGQVAEGKMELALSAITVRPNQLSESAQWVPVNSRSSHRVNDPESGETPAYYTYYHDAGYLEWYPLPTGSAIAAMVPSIIQGTLSNLFNSVLRNVTFHPDGNITATYAPLPEDIDFINDLMMGSGIRNRPESDWLASPFNLANYYVDGKSVYIRPNISMILRQIQLNSTRSDSGEGISIGMDEIKKFYEVLTSWFNKGIELTIKENPKTPYHISPSKRVLYEGDVIILIDKSELESLFPLLPHIKPLIPEDILNRTLMGGLTVDALIDTLIDGLLNAETFELGIFLNKTIN